MMEHHFLFNAGSQANDLFSKPFKKSLEKLVYSFYWRNKQFLYGRLPFCKNNISVLIWSSRFFRSKWQWATALRIVFKTPSFMTCDHMNKEILLIDDFVHKIKTLAFSIVLLLSCEFCQLHFCIDLSHVHIFIVKIWWTVKEWHIYYYYYFIVICKYIKI